jgi:acyl-CoA reductase-like NAD-dependent aldehyde dehydrogenase
METRLLIAGEQVAGEGGPLSVENPFTETELASVGLPSSAQVDAAIAAAREAARSWAATPAIERGESSTRSRPACAPGRTSSPS